MIKTKERKGTVKRVKSAKVGKQLKKEKKYELTIGLRELLEAGCHLGHKVAKTHPKARANIYMAKDGAEIIDLVKTKEGLEKAADFIHQAVGGGKKIVLVGTKRQAKEVVRRVAIECGAAYVTDRWLGGTITNWEQIVKNIRKLNDLKEGVNSGRLMAGSKKEQAESKKEMARLEKMVGGLTSLERLFDILVVIDVGFERSAVKEAMLRGVKIVAIVDTDADPGKIDYPIIANDDNVKSISLIVEELGRAIKR